jgi:hypothetical protein
MKRLDEDVKEVLTIAACLVGIAMIPVVVLVFVGLLAGGFYGALVWAFCAVSGVCS